MIYTIKSVGDDMKLYVVRHGEVPSNTNRIISGSNNEELTEKGIQQALKIKEQIKDVQFDAVFCSPVLRAKQTASIIAPDYDIIFDNRLQERDPGNMLGHKRDEIDKSEWNSLDKEVTIYNGESLLAGIHRAKKFMDDIEKKYKDKVILIITHMFICKSIWMIENDINDVAEANEFFQNNDEIIVYNHK